jgi:hypothetical protein
MTMEIVKEYLGENAREELLHALEQLKILGWKEIKPWSEFFSVFKPPQWNVKHLEQRMTTNLLHYRSNYLIVCLVIIILQMIFSPYLILVLLLVTAFNGYALFIYKKPLIIGEYTFNDTTKLYACVGISAIFLVISGALEQLLWTVIYCSLSCLIHMVFRPRSVTSKTNKLYEELRISGITWFGGKPSTDDAHDGKVDLENPPPSEDEAVGDLMGQSVRKRQAAGSAR